MGTVTHGTAPGSSIGCGCRAGHTPQRRWRWPCTGTRSPPRSRSCQQSAAGRCPSRWDGGGGTPHPPRFGDPLPAADSALTRRHRRRTSRRSAGTAPRRGTVRRAAAGGRCSACGPTSPGGGSPGGASTAVRCHPLASQALGLPPHLLPTTVPAQLPQFPIPVPIHTVQGCQASALSTSGQSRLRRQELPKRSAVGSSTPCRLAKSFSASPSKFPQSPTTRPRCCGSSRTYTLVPGVAQHGAWHQRPTVARLALGTPRALPAGLTSVPEHRQPQAGEEEEEEEAGAL